MNVKVKMHPTLGFKVASNGMVWMPKRGGAQRYSLWHWTFGCLNSHGYAQVFRDGKAYKVHRLVAETFLDNPNGYKVIDHISRDRSDNNVCNLQFCTQQQNMLNRCDNFDRSRVSTADKTTYMREYMKEYRKTHKYKQDRSEEYARMKSQGFELVHGVGWVKTEAE